MARSLPKDRQLDRRELGLYVQVNGVLTAPFLVEMQIIDDAAGYPGTVTVPIAGGWSELTVLGLVATGVFGVYDEDAAATWTPASAISSGRVRWRYKVADGDDYVYVERAFEVVATTVTQVPTEHIALVQELKDAGVTGVTDRALWLSIKDWTKRVLAATAQSLGPVWESKRLYARTGEGPFLPTPLYGLSIYRIEEDDSDLDLTDLLVFGATVMGRKNPRIERSCNVRPGYSDGVRRVVTVTGAWGYFEPDTFAPPEFLTSTMLSALADVLMNTEAKPPELGPVKREQTDAHEIEFAVIATKVRAGWLSLLKSPELREAIEVCRRPISLAVTGAE